jgi:dolichyl-phosphate-mannose-protein mannosyltransferase
MRSAPPGSAMGSTGAQRVEDSGAPGRVRRDDPTMLGARMRWRRAPFAWSVVAAGGILAGFALRVWVLSSPLGALESDEAVVGLMARRALDGDFSVFYWGALYGGSQEALLTAPFFAVFGSSTLALKLVALALYAVAGVLVWLVGRRTVGEPAARVAAALFWLWPPFFVWWSTKARAYFASGLLLGLAALLLVLRLRERDSKRDAALLGLVLGLGLWATLQSFLLAGPALLWLAIRRPAAYRLAPFALPAAAVGALPWLAWNATHGWNAVLPRSVAGSETTYFERFRDFFGVVLPEWLGVRLPYSLDWTPNRAVGVAVVVLALCAFALVLVRRPPRMELLLLVGAAFPFLYASSSFTFFVDEPRYLVFLAPIPALLLAAGLVRAGLIPTAVALLCLGTFSAVGLVQMERQGRYSPLRVPSNIDPVLETLERHHVRHVLANYWIAYRITFESRERIVASPSGFWRYRPYHDAVAAEPLPGRVFLEGSRNEREARESLVRMGYERLLVDGFVVYVPRRDAG